MRIVAAGAPPGGLRVLFEGESELLGMNDAANDAAVTHGPIMTSP